MQPNSNSQDIKTNIKVVSVIDFVMFTLRMSVSTTFSYARQ